MHVLIIAIGSAGDVHPFLGLARSFQQRGHRVSFCTSPAFADVVSRCGLRLLPLGTVEEYQAAMGNPALWDPKTSFRTLWGIVGGYIRPLYATLEREVDEETIIVGSLWAFSARLMQEKHGTPYVSVQVSPSTFLSAKYPPTHKRMTISVSWPYPVRRALMWVIERGVTDRVCGRLLNEVRAELGLRPVKFILGRWLHSPQGVVGLFTDWFAPPQTDWPAKVSLTGFPLFDESELHELDAEMAAFLDAGEPPIVFTPGSTMVDTMDYFSKAAGALEALGQRGVFLVKAGEPLPKLGGNVAVRSYVPLSRLLPRAKLLVHHGGIGTASQAFAAGLPQLAVSFAHDQFDNAARVERLGCGLRLDAPLESASLLAALKRLLGEPEFLQRAQELRGRTEPGEVSCRRAVEAVEAVAGRSGIAPERPSAAYA